MNFTALMNMVLWPVFIAVSFVAWPIAGRYMGLPGSWNMNLVMMGSLLTLIPLSLRSMVTGPSPAWIGVVVMVVVGAINGLALHVYAGKTAAGTDINVTTFICTVTVLMVVITPFNDWLLNGQTFSLRQIAGIILAPVVIYLIVSK